MLCTVSAPDTSLPKTVCLLSSHVAGAVVRKNWEPLVPLFREQRERGHSTRLAEAAALRSGSHARARVGHGQREGSVVAQRAMELVLELVAPNGCATGTIAKRVARLDHEALDHAVKDDAIVICRAARCEHGTVEATRQRLSLKRPCTHSPGPHVSRSSRPSLGIRRGRA